MGSVFPGIDDRIRRFINEQRMFFVATAPLAESGHVNLSPKGLDSFRILDEVTVAYADLAGSGIETVAHVRENGRIVLLFCAFQGAPKIIRLHGRGEVICETHSDFECLAGEFPELKGLRSIIRVTCTRISDSCGFGVPLYDFVGQRSQLSDWAENKGADEVRKYVRDRNSTSIDGLLGILRNKD